MPVVICHNDQNGQKMKDCPSPISKTYVIEKPLPHESRQHTSDHSHSTDGEMTRNNTNNYSTVRTSYTGHAHSSIHSHESDADSWGNNFVSIDELDMPKSDIYASSIHNINDRTTTKRKKSVSFNTNLRVILIPSVVDYHAAGLTKHLWWCGADYQTFQASAFSEIKLLSVFEGIGLNAARKLLYQPDHSRNEKQHAQITSFHNAMGAHLTDNDEMNENNTLLTKSSISCQKSALRAVSSDGNLKAKYEQWDSSKSPSSPRISSAFDEALSLCVPLKEYIQISLTDNARGKRNMRRRGRWLDSDVSVGLASAVALGLLLVPVVFGLEKYMQSLL